MYFSRSVNDVNYWKLLWLTSQETIASYEIHPTLTMHSELGNTSGRLRYDLL